MATSSSLSGPIKLLFPRGPVTPGDFPWQVLGLGDIAIPGLLACLALRYDGSRTPDMQSRAQAASDAFARTRDLLDSNQVSNGDIMQEMAKAAMGAVDEIERLDDEAKRRVRRRTRAVPHPNPQRMHPACIPRLRCRNPSRADA